MFPNKVKKTFNNLSAKYGEDQNFADDESEEEKKEQSYVG